jgi:hypothetical protein
VKAFKDKWRNHLWRASYHWIVRRLCEFPGKGGTEESPAVNGMESEAPIMIEVEATGGTSVAPGDKVRRGQDLGTSPDFSGRVMCPIDGLVEACRFDPGTHRFKIIIIPENGEKV